MWSIPWYNFALSWSERWMERMPPKKTSKSHFYVHILCLKVHLNVCDGMRAVFFLSFSCFLTQNVWETCRFFISSKLRFPRSEVLKSHLEGFFISKFSGGACPQIILVGSCQRHDIKDTGRRFLRSWLKACKRANFYNLNRTYSRDFVMIRND